MSNVAVIGAGAWGRNLARNFHALDALGMICDTDPGTLSAMSRLYVGVPTTTDYDEVLANPSLQGVAIAAPAITHFGLAKRALLRGNKHVFVEKPFALTMAEGIELVRLAELRRRMLMVGHVMHYHPAVGTLKTMIDDGVLGRIHYIYSTRTNIGRIRNEENILWSFAPHDVSAILMLLGETPRSVRTSGGNHLREDIFDVTMTAMNFASGVQGHVFVSWLHPVKEQKLVVVGDKQMAVFDDQADKKLRLFAHEVRWRSDGPVATKAIGRPIDLDSTEPLHRECSHFLECLRRGTSPRTDGYEALRVLAVLEACQLSLEREGEMVVVREHDDSNTDPATLDVHPSAFLHETATIDAGARVGAGTRIWHFSHVLRDTTIGSGCTIGQNVMIGPAVSVGDGCKIQNNVSVYRGVTLEEQVFCGPSVVFTNVRNPRSATPRMGELETTIVRRRATIGANATILCGIEIGMYAFIGAGAVITRNIPDHALAFGNPARVVGWVCACGERLDDDLACRACGRKFRALDDTVAPDDDSVT
jgi:UDP-2-acetamido-3-amino-2,3-dideoxy-glucuronate N-acetyltransferase